MENRKSNYFPTLSLAVSLALFMSFVSVDGLQLHRDTEAAMEEMSNMFRSIFPLIPEQTHYFWKTNQLGSATVHRTTSLKASNLNDVSEENRGYSSKVFPWWRLQLNFRKRGPDCMGKCIHQGLIHPLQCHSLCWTETPACEKQISRNRYITKLSLLQMAHKYSLVLIGHTRLRWCLVREMMPHSTDVMRFFNKYLFVNSKFHFIFLIYT